MIVGVDNEIIGILFKTFAILLLSGIISLLVVPARAKPVINIIAVFLVAMITGSLAVISLMKGDIEFIVNGGSFFGEIPMRIDALSAWFILVINFTSITGALYGFGYLKSSVTHSAVASLHWISFIIFHSSMLIVCMVQHTIAFVVAWEIMSVSSFLLVLFDHTNKQVIKAGVNYLVQMHLSVVLITIAFIWVFFLTGNFDFKSIGTFFDGNVNIWLFFILFAGFGLKAGFLGLHTWLPLAHPAAPSHISGVMSGVIVKMGIYGIFRMITFLKYDFLIIGEIILTLSLLTGLFGIINAAVHRDFKMMLAYCTIENIGIIGIGIGLGLIGIGNGQVLLSFFGFGGALLHALNHSLYKSLLFFSAGSVYHQTHTRDMDQLGGLMKFMPKTGLLFLTGALAIGGFPVLNGFISEFMIYTGIIKGIDSTVIAQSTLMIITLAAMSLIGGISLLAFTKTFGVIFLGSPRMKLEHEPAEVNSWMLVPQYLIIAVMLWIAFAPGFFFKIILEILDKGKFLNINLDVIILESYLSVLKNISLASLIFITLTGIILVLRWILTRNANKAYSVTWGCGYNAPDINMQYTGKSFSKTLGKLLNFILIEKKDFTEIKSEETFPVTRKYRSLYLDIIENKILEPMILGLMRFINLFQFVQNGKIQAYVLYGIIFILIIFIGTLLNLWH